MNYSAVSYDEIRPVLLPGDVQGGAGNQSFNGSFSSNSSFPYYYYAPEGMAAFETGYMHLILGSVHMYLNPAVAICGLVTNMVGGLVLLLCGERLGKRNGEDRVLLAASVWGYWFFLLSVLLSWLATGPALIQQNIHWCYYLNMLTNTSRFIATWCGVAILIRACVNTTTSSGSNSTPSASSSACQVSSRLVVIGVVIAAVIISVNLTLTVDSQLIADFSFCQTIPKFISVIQAFRHADLFLNSLLPDVAGIVLIAITYYSLRKNFSISRLRVSCGESYQSPACSQEEEEDAERLSTALSQDVLLSVCDVTRAICISFSVLLALEFPSLMFRVHCSIKQLVHAEFFMSTPELYLDTFCQVLSLLGRSSLGLLLLATWARCRKVFSELLQDLKHKLRARKQKSWTELLESSAFTHHIIQAATVQETSIV